MKRERRRKLTASELRALGTGKRRFCYRGNPGRVAAGLSDRGAGGELTGGKMVARKGRREADPWRTRRVMGLYAAGEPISQISRQVGWSEGRVRKVLREAGVIVTEEDGEGEGEK